ncbi:unnamed protein product [Pleuronectes platessa]|uniref:Uncharacterized protein n=1 Tax=Pleuronectes platessa TaxID=8262 RepID=A0A9N7UFV9_PLEPL|nr:unnamed protein product [Pleuronectes platessa]
MCLVSLPARGGGRKRARSGVLYIRLVVTRGRAAYQHQRAVGAPNGRFGIGQMSSEVTGEAVVNEDEAAKSPRLRDREACRKRPPYFKQAGMRRASSSVSE